MLRPPPTRTAPGYALLCQPPQAMQRGRPAHGARAWRCGERRLKQRLDLKAEASRERLGLPSAPPVGCSRYAAPSGIASPDRRRLLPCCACSACLDECIAHVHQNYACYAVLVACDEVPAVYIPAAQQASQTWALACKSRSRSRSRSKVPPSGSSCRHSACTQLPQTAALHAPPHRCMCGVCGGLGSSVTTVCTSKYFRKAANPGRERSPLLVSRTIWVAGDQRLRRRAGHFLLPAGGSLAALGSRAGGHCHAVVGACSGRRAGAERALAQPCHVDLPPGPDEDVDLLNGEVVGCPHHIVAPSHRGAPRAVPGGLASGAAPPESLGKASRAGARAGC